MAAPPFLTLDQVAVGYGRRTVVAGVSIQLEAGGFTGLLGANGSGKSTLIRTLLGIIPPLSGRIEFRLPDGRQPVIGYVPQRESLDPIFLFSGREVAEMGAFARVRPGRRLSATERDWVEECLRETGSESFAGQRFSELSGGQKQRVLLARALATRPDWLVLDEPTAGIDAAAAKAIAGLLLRLNQGGLTILMVNHELHTVRQLVTQVIWLERGTAVQGKVETFLSRDRLEDLLQLKLG